MAGGIDAFNLKEESFGDLSDEKAQAVAESFIVDYYGSVYLNTDLSLGERTVYSGLGKYIEAKLDYDSYITPDVENYKISVEITDSEKKYGGILFTVFWREEQT